MSAPERRGSHRPLLDIIVAHVGQPLPGGCDAWGMRSVHPDLRSSRGFRWPWPGGVATAPGPLLDHRGSCPIEPGDGICVATTAPGMASGGIPAHTVLLTAHATADVIGDTEAGKLRLTRALVVEVVDLPALARTGNLTGADLAGADLTRADLTGADLTGAYLTDADLAGADLTRADLTDADLTDADLTGANLTDADLTDADLTDAYLTDADLAGADLTGANLTDANLTRADLGGWERGPDGYARRVAAGVDS